MNKDIFKAIMRPALESNTTRDGNQFGELLNIDSETIDNIFRKAITYL